MICGVERLKPELLSAKRLCGGSFPFLALPCQQLFLLFPLISVVVRLIQILFGLHLPVITELVATATAATKACEGSKAMKPFF